MRLHVLLTAAATVLIVLPSGARAQEAWGASYYPYFAKGPNDKLSLMVHYQYAQPADYWDQVPFARSLSVETGINADGSRSAVARFKGPRIADGWRVYGEAGAVRENRFGYFGLGNDTDEFSQAGDPFLQRARRVRYYGQADLTRRISGNLHITAGASLVRSDFSPLPRQSTLKWDCTRVSSGPFSSPGYPEFCQPDTDLGWRAALVFDSRDFEFVSSRGALVEAGGFGGSGGEGYTGAYLLGQGFLSPREGMVFAGRVVGRWMSEDAPLDARYRLPAWERSIPVLGGPESHRSFIYGRYTGRNLVLANLEYRQDILNFGDYGAISALAFLDAGAVSEWEAGYADASSDSGDLHIGGGTGLALRILRSTVLTFNFAWGGDGHRFSMGTGWMF